MPCMDYQDSRDGREVNLENKINYLTRLLCSACRQLAERSSSGQIYDAELSEWYKKHQEEDQRRIAEANKREAKAAIKKRLLKQLTKEELDALGILGEAP